MPRRKNTITSQENLDRWVVSYADFITLLFAFFVVMFGASSVNEGKFSKVTESLFTAFKAEPRSIEPIQVGELSRSPNDSVIETESAHQRNEESTQGENTLRVMAKNMEAEMASLIEGGEIRVNRTEDWLEIEINTSILFPSGSFNLVGESRPVLQKIARIIAAYPNPINVEGFTDNVPISTPEIPSNWELSASRAASVVHLFSKEGVEPSRMSAIGYGEYRPIASNSTAEGRRKNRRVVVAVLAMDFSIKSDRKKDEAIEVTTEPSHRVDKRTEDSGIKKITF